MGKKYRIIHLLLLLLVVIAGQACVQNTISSSWVDPSLRGPINGKILVVGIFNDTTTHRIFEDSFVESLNNVGAEAVPSHHYGQEKKRHSSDWLQQAVKQSGASFVMFTHLKDEKIQVDKVNPHGIILGGGVYGDSLHGYHSYLVGRTLEQGQTLTRTEDYIDAILFDIGLDKPIWSSSSKSVNLNHYLREDDERLDNIFIQDMKKHHLL